MTSVRSPRPIPRGPEPGRPGADLPSSSAKVSDQVVDVAARGAARAEPSGPAAAGMRGRHPVQVAGDVRIGGFQPVIPCSDGWSRRRSACHGRRIASMSLGLRAIWESWARLAIRVASIEAGGNGVAALLDLVEAGDLGAAEGGMVRVAARAAGQGLRIPASPERTAAVSEGNRRVCRFRGGRLKGWHPQAWRGPSPPGASPSPYPESRPAGSAARAILVRSSLEQTLKGGVSRRSACSSRQCQTA